MPEWQRIHAWLRRAILDVAIEPGAALSEQDIAARCGTSRTPVREALLRLADEGLVDILPQRGTYVARMDLTRMAEALFVREAVEGAILRRMCALEGHADVGRELAAIASDQARAIAAGDVAVALAADERFHLRLVEAAGLPGVWPVVQQARDLHHRVRAIAVPQLGSARGAIEEHRRIAAAVRAGDAAGAEAVLARHLRRNLDLARAIATRHPAYFAAPVAVLAEPA